MLTFVLNVSHKRSYGRGWTKDLETTSKTKSQEGEDGEFVKKLCQAKRAPNSYKTKIKTRVPLMCQNHSEWLYDILHTEKVFFTLEEYYPVPVLDKTRHLKILWSFGESISMSVSATRYWLNSNEFKWQLLVLML